MSDIATTSIINSIRKLSGVNKTLPETMVIGTIKTLTPLSIDIQQKYTIEEPHLFLGQMCRPHKVKIPHTHEYNGKTEIAKTDISATTTGTVGPTPTPGVITVVDAGHQHDIKQQVTEDVHKKGTDFEESVTIEIEPKLKVGDKVLMFAFNNYQMYYVAERLEDK